MGAVCFVEVASVISLLFFFYFRCGAVTSVTDTAAALGIGTGDIFWAVGETEVHSYDDRRIHWSVCGIP